MVDKISSRSCCCGDQTFMVESAFRLRLRGSLPLPFHSLYSIKYAKRVTRHNVTFMSRTPVTPPPNNASVTLLTTTRGQAVLLATRAELYVTSRTQVLIVIIIPLSIHPILKKAGANYGTSKYILLETEFAPFIGNPCPACWSTSKSESLNGERLVECSAIQTAACL